MVKTKQTPHGGSSSHRPGGVVTTRFASAEEEAEWQFADAPGEEETEDSQEWPEYVEEETGASKSTGKAGDQPQQAEGGPEVPPKENAPPIDPQPGTSKDPTDPPATVSTQDPTQDPTVDKPEEAEVETPPELIAYVKSYKQAGKTWLDTVLNRKEQAYNTLYDRLDKIGAKHKENLDQAVRDQVFASIKARSGKYLSKDEFTMYVEQEDPPQKQRYRLTEDDAKEALKDYYDEVDTLNQAQANLAHSTKVLEEKIEDKTVFLDIIKQMQKATPKATPKATSKPPSRRG